MESLAPRFVELTWGDFSLDTYPFHKLDSLFFSQQTRHMPDRVVPPLAEHRAENADPRSPDASSRWRSPAWCRSDYFGVAHYKTVESWFFPKLYDTETNTIRPNTSPHRLFSGLGWGLVAVLPLQDVPGHYCGVICIGRNGEYPNDYVVRLFPEDRTRSSNAGFLLPFSSFRAIVKEEGNDQSTMVAYNNPLHLVRTILRLGRLFPSLPLIGWVEHFDPEPHLRTSDWSVFKSIKNKVFWSQQHDIRVVRAAVEQAGSVIVYSPFEPYPGVKESTFGGRPVFRPGPETFFQIVSDAKAWPKYLGDRFKEMETKEAVDELGRIALTRGRFDRCLAQLPASPQIDSMRRLVRHRFQPCDIRVGQYQIFEESAGWFRKTDRQKSPTFVGDAKCRIDHVFYNSRRTRKIYRGQIVFESRTIPFDVPAMDFEKDAIGCIRRLVEESGMSEPTFQCKNRLYKNIVFALSPLKRIHPVKSVGWNARTQSFEFPQFRILKSRGIVGMVDRARMLPDDFPAKYLEPPDLENVPPMEKMSLDSDMLHEVASFISACLFTATRHVFKQDSRPTFIGGGNGRLFEYIVGCLGIPTVSLQGQDDFLRIANYNVKHRWPIFVPSKMDPESLIRPLKPERHCNTIFHFENVDVVEKAIRYRTDVNAFHFSQQPHWREEQWRDIGPALSCRFFERLLHYIRKRTSSSSVQGFVSSECGYWKSLFRPGTCGEG